MKDLLEKIIREIGLGHKVCLATVTASSGAAPRGAGARMLIGREGRIYGTVGGGAVEFEAIRLGQLCLERGEAAKHEYKLSPNAKEDIGMICGGDVQIHFQLLEADNLPLLLLEQMLKACEERREALLIQNFQASGQTRPLLLYSAESGLVGGEGEEDLQNLLARESGEPHLFSLGEELYFTEALVLPGFVYIMGGGHVAQALVPVLRAAHFAPIVLEDREAFLRSKLFPGAHAICRVDFMDVAASLEISPQDYVCIMTRGHHYDYELQVQVLGTPARYIGVIGSRGKRRITEQKLRERGVPEADLARIHSPIGLEIGAETPEEIAISIAAELIAERRRKSARSLRRQAAVLEGSRTDDA